MRKTADLQREARRAEARSKWAALIQRALPFADAASDDLPLKRLIRLSLFQVTVGMAVVLLNGTLNRVMIIEMDVPAWLVATMVSLPLLFAPFRALVGFRSDTHRSAFGWRRVPYIWMGTLLQFGGLAIMPFALLVLSENAGPEWVGEAAAAASFLAVGAGLHITQTAGLALATDIAPAETRPRVVALLYVMLLLGMVAAALGFGWLLSEFTPVRLIQVIQGAAALTFVLNMYALYKQEPMNAARAAKRHEERPKFADAWSALMAGGRTGRLLVAVALGTIGFSMQDILLEPYGGQILGLSVSATTMLTALLAGGTIAGFAIAARGLSRGGNPHRLAAYGVLFGIAAFALVVFSGITNSPLLFRAGTLLIGFGGGMFAVGTLTAAMDLAARTDHGGLALGAWGAVQATAAGAAIACGGVLRDVISALAETGRLGTVLTDPQVGYSAVYQLEILFLFATLIAIGPLVSQSARQEHRPNQPFGLAEFPG